MRDSMDIAFAADNAFYLAWYARSVSGSPETDPVVIAAQRDVERRYPEQMNTRYWENPYLMGRMEGVMAGLRWAQGNDPEDAEAYEDDPEMPTVYGSGYDT